MSAVQDTRLRLVQRTQTWRIWDGAVVVFEPLSGDTHRIDHPGGRILAFLAESESSRETVNSALAAIATPEEIDEALNLLLAMELLEPA